MKQQSPTSITRKGEKVKKSFLKGWEMLPACYQQPVKDAIINHLHWSNGRFRNAVKGVCLINLYEINHIENVFNSLPPIPVNPWTGNYIITPQTLKQLSIHKDVLIA